MLASCIAITLILKKYVVIQVNDLAVRIRLVIFMSKVQLFYTQTQNILKGERGERRGVPPLPPPPPRFLGEVFTLQGIYCRKKISAYNPYIDIHFIYFLHKTNLLHLIHVDLQIFRCTAYKIFHCSPSASPAHETENTAVCCYIITNLTTVFSAKRVIYINI